MSKLRDWWPSADIADCNESSSLSAAGAVPKVTGSTTAAATLRLSEVADALNAMPNLRTSSCSSSLRGLTHSFSSPSLSDLRPCKSPIKLSNTVAHKEELLKKLLTRSESSSDLRMGLGQKSCPASVPSSPVQSNAAEVPWKSFKEIMERGMRSKSEITHPSLITLGTTEDSSELRKRKRDKTLNLMASASSPGQDSQDNVNMPTSATQPRELACANKDGLSRRQIHIFSERERRKGMTHLYSVLHSLLPDAKPKTDRCTVLTEAVDYIHALQAKLSDLGTQKDEMMMSINEQLQKNTLEVVAGSTMNRGSAVNAWSHMEIADKLLNEEVKKEILAAADVVVRFCGRDVFITLNSPRHNGVWSGILDVLHEHDIEFLSVTLSASNDMDYHCIHAKFFFCRAMAREPVGHYKEE
ncbi:hypothetical protein KP509_1Z015800 [Ceratopteris richardii]|nr:hypothetical protein KP509_1Z015800 [Ceratopteris richardii]